jgi:beta-phosphoglucomutase
MAEAGLQIILFDFDGVILESADIKTQAFKDLFASERRHVPAILRYHLKHAGISRFKKFDYIYRRILRRPLDEAEKKRLGRAFSKKVYERVLRCPMVPGAEDFLKRYHRKIRFFIISGTPQMELRSIVRARKLGRFFKAVYGTPRTKAKLANFILKRARVSPAQVLVVGDALADRDAARSCGVHFVARIPGRKKHFFSKADWRVADLRGLAPLLRSKGLLPAA